jgi:hypothetical protein
LPDSQLVPHEEDGPVERPTRMALFGYKSTEGTARLYYRDTFWRGSRALLFAALGLLIAPVALLIPPHGIWTIGSLVLGGTLAHLKWAERRTLVFLDANCPRCDADLRCTRPTRIRDPHTITCETCHHPLELQIVEE